MNARKSLESAIEYAANAGFEFAQIQIQETPDAGPFAPHDEMPEEDYIDFKREFGGLFLSEMEAAYRKAFNEKFANHANGHSPHTTHPTTKSPPALSPHQI